MSMMKKERKDCSGVTKKDTVLSNAAVCTSVQGKSAQQCRVILSQVLVSVLLYALRTIHR